MRVLRSDVVDNVMREIYANPKIRRDFRLAMKRREVFSFKSQKTGKVYLIGRSRDAFSAEAIEERVLQEQQKMLEVSP